MCAKKSVTHACHGFCLWAHADYSRLASRMKFSCSRVIAVNSRSAAVSSSSVTVDGSPTASQPVVVPPRCHSGDTVVSRPLQGLCGCYIVHHCQPTSVNVTLPPCSTWMLDQPGYTLGNHEMTRWHWATYHIQPTCQHGALPDGLAARIKTSVGPAKHNSWPSSVV